MMPNGTDYPVAPTPLGVPIFTGPILATVTYSAPIDVWGYDEINVRLKVGDLGSGPITSIVASIQWTDTTSPAGDEDWADIEVESLAAGGVITEDDGAYTKDVSTLTAPFSIGFLATCAGRLMRIGFLAAGGDASSAAVATATLR